MILTASGLKMSSGIAGTCLSTAVMVNFCKILEMITFSSFWANFWPMQLRGLDFRKKRKNRKKEEKKDHEATRGCRKKRGKGLVPSREGNVEVWIFLLSLVLPPLRLKFLGILPVFGVAVEDIDVHLHHGAGRNCLTIKHNVLGQLSLDERHRGVDSQALLEDNVEVLELAEHLGGDLLPLTENVVNLLVKGSLNLGIGGNKPKGPSHRGTGGVVT